MKKCLSAILCAGMLLCNMAGTALAAESKSTDDVKQSPALMQNNQMPLPVPIYPAEVRVSEENGVCRLERVYYLTSNDNPASIPTEDFEREGHRYTLVDLLKNDQAETDSKDHVEVLTLNTETKDMAEILKLLKPELEVTTEDGYTGTLTLDHTSIAVEAAGYKNRSYNVSASRTYPNLSDADTSLIPKSVEENGRTLTLADINWQSTTENQVDGYELAQRYTAVATYTGTASSKYATGYIVTANYGGEVVKTACDTVVYTAVFSSAEKSSGFDIRWLAIPAILLMLIAGGYVGYKEVKHYKNKKRGYE